MSTNSSPVVSVNYALSYPGLSPDPNIPPKGIMGRHSCRSKHWRAVYATDQRDELPLIPFEHSITAHRRPPRHW